MIAHNKTSLENDWIHEQLTSAYQEACIDRDEMNSVKKIYEVGFYTPEPLMGLGLFLVTTVILIFSFALLVLFFPISGTAVTQGIESIIFGTATYFVLEWFVARRHFRSGADEALLWGSGMSLVAGINLCFDISPMANAAIVCALATWYTLRFLESLAAVTAWIAILACVVLSLNKSGASMKALIPFALMAISVVTYLLAHVMRGRERFRYYRRCLLLMEIATLAVFYVAGNYYFTGEAAKKFLNLDFRSGFILPFDKVYWVLTITVPWVYLLLGVVRRDPVLVRMGLVVLALSLATIRYYYHFIRLDIAMIMGGTALVVVSASLLRWLRTPRFGFHIMQRYTGKPEKKRQMESVLIGQLLRSQQQGSGGGGTFGGGSGGGSGAGGSY